MAIQSQRVPHLEVPTMSNISIAQLASLEEIINHVSNSMEATTREFECLTSWLLHREERKRKGRCGFIHDKHGHKSLAPGGCRT
jgi:hypothetical protein